MRIGEYEAFEISKTLTYEKTEVTTPLGVAPVSYTHLVENWKELGLHSETAVVFNVTSKEQVIINTWYGLSLIHICCCAVPGERGC